MINTLFFKSYQKNIPKTNRMAENPLPTRCVENTRTVMDDVPRPQAFHPNNPKQVLSSPLTANPARAPPSGLALSELLKLLSALLPPVSGAGLALQITLLCIP